jgi:hypothetical protein
MGRHKPYDAPLGGQNYPRSDKIDKRYRQIEKAIGGVCGERRVDRDDVRQDGLEGKMERCRESEREVDIEAAQPFANGCPAVEGQSEAGGNKPDRVYREMEAR